MTRERADMRFGQRLSSILQRHGVALISLAVALFATSYNTWRNQTTEAHRNTRAAAFAVLDALGQLQEISDRRYYGGDHGDANRIAGWGKVAVVRDMASLISAGSEERARGLEDRWRENVDKLERGDETAEHEIAQSIMALRAEILTELRELR